MHRAADYLNIIDVITVSGQVEMQLNFSNKIYRSTLERTRQKLQAVVTFALRVRRINLSDEREGGVIHGT